MYAYLVRAGHGSSKLFVEFKSSPTDSDFRDALATALRPFGVEFTWDGNYLNSKRASDPTQLGNVFIESDQWGLVWGHAFGSENKENIDALDRALAETGIFVKMP